MITDERLDQLIRSSLEWQASTTAARQPSAQRAMQRLAARVGPPTTILRPRLAPQPGARRVLTLVTLALLLAALLAAAALVGSQLLRPPLPPAPGPFGYAAPCDIPTDTGLARDAPNVEAVLNVISGADIVTLYADGALIRDVSTAGETRASTVTGSQIALRRLTAQGVELVLDRVEQAGLTPGCRFLRTTIRTADSSGNLTAHTAAGSIDVSWGPGPGPVMSRDLTHEHEAQLTDLVTAVSRPQTWLPDDAWVDSAEVRIQPDHWLIVLDVRPTSLPEGEAPILPDGTRLEGTDPRSSELEMPGGASLLGYGEELSSLDGVNGSGSTLRCGEATTDQAVALATSQDAIDFGIGFGADGDGDGNPEGDVYADDLSSTVSIGIQPVFGAGYDCADLAVDRAAFEQPRATATPAPVVGDLAGVDPCTLVPAEAAAIVGADAREVRMSGLALGAPAQACLLFDPDVPSDSLPDVPNPLPAGHRATVTLFPWRVTSGEAVEIVGIVFGAGAVEVSTPRGQMWVVNCVPPSPDLPCNDTFAGWARSRLVLFEFSTAAEPIEGPTGPTFQPFVTPEEARYFVDATLVGLDD